MTTPALAEAPPPAMQSLDLIGRLNQNRAVTPTSETTPCKTPIAGRRRRATNGRDTGTSRHRQLDALWAMSPADRVAAMWRGELTLFQLTRWSSRAPHEVPLLGDEFAYIAMRTPEWLGE